MSMTISGSSGLIFPDGSGQETGIGRNRIINGDMRIDQRNAGASVTATTSNLYTVDRWRAYASQSSKYTVQQNAGSVTPPVGFTNYLGVTSSSAYTVGAGEFFLINQNIEGFNVADLGWGTANAKTVTLSFWVRSSLTGTFGGAFNNDASNRSYPFTYTISSANTWEQKTVTITGDTSGTWLTTNGIGVQLQFGLGVGSTYSGTAGAWAGSAYYSATGATSVVGTNGATFYITGVQLEVGSTATPFERRLYGQELALCQRYYEKCGWDQGSVPGSTSGYTPSITANYMGSTTTSFSGMNWMVIKRAAPTLTFYGSIGGATETVNVAVDFQTGNSLGTVTATRIGDCGFGYLATVSGSSYGCIYRVVASAEL